MSSPSQGFDKARHIKKAYRQLSQSSASQAGEPGTGAALGSHTSIPPTGPDLQGAGGQERGGGAQGELRGLPDCKETQEEAGQGSDQLHRGAETEVDKAVRSPEAGRQADLEAASLVHQRPGSGSQRQDTDSGEKTASLQLQSVKEDLRAAETSISSDSEVAYVTRARDNWALNRIAKENSQHVIPNSTPVKLSSAYRERKLKADKLNRKMEENEKKKRDAEATQRGAKPFDPGQSGPLACSTPSPVGPPIMPRDILNTSPIQVYVYGQDFSMQVCDNKLCGLPKVETSLNIRPAGKTRISDYTGEHVLMKVYPVLLKICFAVTITTVNLIGNFCRPCRLRALQHKRRGCSLRRPSVLPP